MLAKLVQKAVKEPLSIEMLAEVVPPWCGVEFYDKLKKYKTLQAAMQGKKCLAVLYQVHDRKRNVQNEAGHFILINTAGKVPEYFSSSGWAVGKEVAATYSDPKIFQRLLGKNFIENRVPLEKIGNTNDCWRFVLARAILSEMPLRNFQKLFAHHLRLENADDIVTLMTMLIIEQTKLKLR